MADDFKPCSIDGCNGNAHRSATGARGWCQAHYVRWKRHGSPLGGRTSERVPHTYYRGVVITHEGDECLLWPFGCDKKGYGQIVIDGRTRPVHRVLCAEVYGPPPSPKHHAAHSCGKGHLGCVAKRHLSWKTPKENVADALAHGTRLHGEQHHYSKLSESQVREIRALRGKVGPVDIGRMFGIGRGTVWRIQTNKIWKGDSAT